MGQSTKEEEAKQKKTENTKYLHRGPVVSATYKVACVKHEIPQDQAKNNYQGFVQNNYQCFHEARVLQISTSQSEGLFK